MPENRRLRLNLDFAEEAYHRAMALVKRHGYEKMAQLMMELFSKDDINLAMRAKGWELIYRKGDREVKADEIYRTGKVPEDESGKGGSGGNYVM